SASSEGLHSLRGTGRIALASSSTTAAHFFIPYERVDLETTTTTGTAHTFRLDPDPSTATTNTHGIGKLFNPSTAIDSSAETINLAYAHGFTTGDSVVYSSGGGDSIGGIGHGNIYYVIVVDATTIQLAETATAADNGEEIDLAASQASGTSHGIG